MVANRVQTIKLSPMPDETQIAPLKRKEGGISMAAIKIGVYQERTRGKRRSLIARSGDRYTNRQTAWRTESSMNNMYHTFCLK